MTATCWGAGRCVQPFAAFADSSLVDCIAIVSSATELLFSRRHSVAFKDDPVRQCVSLFPAASRLLQVQGDEVGSFGLEMVGVFRFDWAFVSRFVAESPLAPHGVDGRVDEQLKDE